MAFTIDSFSDEGTIQVILASDPAVVEDRDAYEKYLKTGDAGCLRLKDGEEPTVFVMSRGFRNYKHKTWVDKPKASVDGKGEFKVEVLDYMMREVRATLVEIKSPEYVPKEKRLETHMKKQGDGILSEEFSLKIADLIAPLYMARMAIISAEQERKADVKKS